MPVVATSQTSIYNNTQDPNAGSSRLSTNPADPISRRLLSGIRFFKFQKIFMGQAIQYQNAGEVCAVSGPPIL